MFLRKRGGGSDSFGNVWESDRHVVEVPDWQGAELLAIRDAGFTVVDAPEATPTPEPEPTPVVEPAPVEPTDVTEPAPPADNPVDETPAAPKARARKATKAQPVQE